MTEDLTPPEDEPPLPPPPPPPMTLGDLAGRVAELAQQLPAETPVMVRVDALDEQGYGYNIDNLYPRGIGEAHVKSGVNYGSAGVLEREPGEAPPGPSDLDRQVVGIPVLLSELVITHPVVVLRPLR